MSEAIPAQDVLILTLRMDYPSQTYFNELRSRHFPPERNYLNAHLTLFHQLPDLPEIMEQLQHVRTQRFEMAVTGLINLRAGVCIQLQLFRTCVYPS